ncbi:MAG: type II secretion system F family protein [Gammaproteobacteria bacterium]|nr:type II secretion system F family protein [Gammaproteobacteria bacterium]
MTLFRYRAARASGEVVEGEMEGADAMTVMRALQNQGLVPIRAEEHTSKAARLSWTRRDVVRSQDIELVAAELAMLLDAGVPLDRALAIMAQLVEIPSLKTSLGGLERAMREGKSFPDALAAETSMYPPLLVNLARAGEMGGKLSEALARAAGYMEAARLTRESLMSAMLYPLILCGLALISVLLMVTFVVPRFATLFDDAGVPLPLATQILAAAGEFLTEYGWAIVAGGAGSAWIIKRRLADPKNKARFDELVLTIPGLGQLIAKVEAARFARIMSTLLASGTAVPNALSIAQSSASNAAIAERLGTIAQAVRAGHGMADQLDRQGVFPRLTGQMLRIGEESDRLVDVLDKLGEMFEKDIDRSMKRAVTLVEPVLILVVGLIVGAVVYGVLSAVLSINELT